MPQPRSVGRLSASTFSLKLLAYITLCIVRVTSKPHGEFKSAFFFLHSVLLPCHQRRFLLLTELQISITSHKRVPVIFLISIKMTLQDQGFTGTPKGWVHKLLFKKKKNKPAINDLEELQWVPSLKPAPSSCLLQLRLYASFIQLDMLVLPM